jgi:hypothetical protein
MIYLQYLLIQVLPLTWNIHQLKTILNTLYSKDTNWREKAYNKKKAININLDSQYITTLDTS